MADSSIATTPGVGANVDTRTNAAGEHRQVMILGEGQAQSDLIATFRPDSVLRVAMDPTTTLVDSFEILDAANTWTLGGNSVPTQAAGKLIVSAAITTLMQSTIRSQASFVYQSPNYMEGVFLATLEAGVVTGNKRCWGFGTLPATSTTATPVANGVVFEIQDTDGTLIGAAYSNSVRTQTVALVRPADGLEHRYAVYYKTSRVYFEIDNLVVGSIATPDPLVMNLPLVMVSVNAASGVPGTAAVLTFSTVSVSDWGRNGTAIVDGTYPWREAQVGKSGGLAVRSAQITPTSVNVAAGNNATVCGPMDVSEAGTLTIIAKNQAAATAWAGAPVLVIEQSDDSVSWSPMAGVRNDTGLAASTHTLPANSANTEYVIDVACEAVSWARVRITTGPTTNPMTVIIAAGGHAFSPAITVQQAPLVKGAQGVNGVSVQNLCDAGRNTRIFALDAYTAAPVAETVQLVVQWYGNAAVAAVVNPAVVPAGKTLRLTGYKIMYQSLASAGLAVVRIRANTGGLGVLASPLVASFEAGSSAAVAGVVTTETGDFPDGLELPAGTGLAFSMAGYGATGVLTLAGGVRFQVFGYEY